jgi:hypothetical protein
MRLVFMDCSASPGGVQFVGTGGRRRVILQRFKISRGKPTMPAIRGSCLCGGIKFEIDGPLLRPLNCHCTFCRKQQGAAFRSRARVLRRDFKWLQGEDLVRSYESTPGFRRGFCGVCGSPVVNWAEPHSPYAQSNPRTLTEYGIALSILDDDPGVRPECHSFVRSKAAWFEITDDLPQYEAYPPAG